MSGFCRILNSLLYVLVFVLSLSACTSGDNAVSGSGGDTDGSEAADLQVGNQCGIDDDCGENEICFQGNCILWEENPCFGVGDCVSDLDCRSGEFCNDACVCEASEQLSCDNDADCGSGMVCYEGLCYTDKENPCSGDVGNCTSDKDCYSNQTCDDTCNCLGGTGDGDLEQDGGPRISVPVDVRFGSVILDHEVERSFVISSVGREDLEILSIELENADDPEFKLIDVPKSSFILEPGDTYTQTVTYKPVDGGIDERNVLVASSDPDTPIARVKLVSDYKGDATAQANYESIDFGKVEVQSGQSSVTVEISNIPSSTDDNMLLDVMDIHIESTDSVDFSLTYEVLNKSFIIAPNNSIQFEVFYHPRTEGEHTDVLVIPNSDKELRIPLSGEGAIPRLMVYPLDENGGVDFGQIRVGHQVNKPVTLKNMGTSILFINTIYLDEESDTAFTLDAGDIPDQGHALQAGDEVTVTLYYLPDAEEINVGVLRIVSNAYDGAVRSFPIEGQGIISKISTDPESIDFGNVLIDTTSQVVVTITNEGDAELTLTEFLFASRNADFRLSEDSADIVGSTLAAGVSDTFTVEYTPTAVETDAANLIIVSDDTEAPEYALPLSGRGVAPKLNVRRLDDPSFVDTVYFGEVNLSETREVELRLENVGEWNLEITAYEITDNSYYDEFSITPEGATFTIVPGGHENITLIYAPVNYPGPDAGELMIHSNDFELADLPILLDGLGSNPRITVTPASWEFSDTLPLGDRTKDFYLTNSAALGELEISRILIGAGTDYVFSIASVEHPLPYTMAEDESMTFSVTFQPADLGDYSGSVVIESDDSQTPLRSVPISGTCVPCPDGWWDLDENHNQCEYECAPTPDPFEICDGFDNDCNGGTDDSENVTSNCAFQDYSNVACINGECSYECMQGFHGCDELGCVYSGAPEHCGEGNCDPCPQPENALAVCSATGLDWECDFICSGGYIKTETGCVAPGDPEYCGPEGLVCPAPSNGIALCIDDACDYQCNVGYHDCPEDPQGPCVASDHPDHCGSLCESCPTPDNATPICIATTGGYMCDFVCNTWYHKEGGECVLNDTVNCCGQDCLSCGPDPANGSMSCEGFACSIGCNEGYHVCDNYCANDLDPLTCGGRCVSCPEPDNSDATCDGTYCGFVCHTGFHKSGNECLWNDLTNCCGPSCEVCSAPEHATPYCNGYSCDFTCDPGYHADGDECVVNGDTNCCGPACIQCPGDPLFGQYFCDGQQCVLSCDAGYHNCEQDCVSDNSVEHCGTSCYACNAPPNSDATCNGFECGFTCQAGYHEESGYCVPNEDVTCCGPLCLICEAPDNAAPVCTDGQCGFVCDSSYHQCGDYCLDDFSIDNCGQSCVPCQHPANSNPFCNGVNCTWECADGYHEESDQCVANNSADCCGPECVVCDNVQHGTAACVAGECTFFCDSGYHACDDVCVSNLSIDHCGNSCEGCPDILNAEENCNGVECGYECYTGYHDEDGVCVQNTSTDCCGPNCTYCPDIYEHGDPLCVQVGPEYYVCDFECDENYHKCGSYCLPDDDVNSCGENCTPCIAPPNGMSFCNESQECDFSCNQGYYQYDYSCMSCITVDKCGSECIQCPPAPPGATAVCDGGFLDPCGFVCNPGYHICQDDFGEDVCVSDSSVYTCGSSCTACPDPNHGYATCNAGECGIVCEEGYHLVGNLCEANDDIDCCGDACVSCPDYLNADEACVDGACTFACHSGYYETPSGCLLCNNVDNCGLQCEECSAPTNSTAFCDTSGGNPACDFSCYGGYHECPGYDNDCFPDSDPNHCGGASGCLQCTVPSGNGTPLCINNQCTIQCDSGYHEENDNCVPNDNPNCCGEDCDGCWSPEFGEGFCNDSGAEAFCDFTCSSGYHRCNTGNSQHASGDDCVFNGSVEHCGSNCDPCPAPETGTETGYGTCISTGYDWVCSVECLPGFHREGNSCVVNDDPWCCGASCQDCPEPVDATATCISGVCGFVCNESYHECGGQCVSDYSELHCGTSCLACFSPAFGFATCDGTSCGIQCYPGYHEESGDCVSNSSTECCGNQCEECTGPANSTSECVGGTHCEWSCNNNYHQCSNECVEDDSVDHCGTLCAPCPEPDNTASYCEEEQCQWDCLEDYYDNDGEPANGCEDYCSPDGYEDVPDDSFLDNDCDGLDGTWDDAIFVSTDGSDVLPGTGDQPKRSIQAAINAAYAYSPKKYVIVSMGTYYESLTLKNGVSVYGGYSKIYNWQRSNGYEVIVSGGVTALTASNINNSTIIDRLTVVSANAGMSENSYAVYLNECTDALIFQHCNIEAGRGGDGEDGVAAYSSGANGQVGGNASGRTGGVGGFSLCGMGYNGGSGGSGGSDGAMGSGPDGGGGGSYGDWEPFNCCDGCQSGLSGGSANTGSVGNEGANGSASGSVINGQWFGEVGGNGGLGSAGLGGSGGGGGGGCKKWSFLLNFCPSENGGGGGGGGGAGCGGEGGYGGNYGGGSFGFFLYNSSPDIIDCHIVSESGGNGGSGGAGSSGGLGGQGGSFAEGSGEAQHGGSGARGGDGGRGGNGGGGSGGVSYCVYRAGTADPYLDPANQYSYGSGGEGGNFSGEADSGDIY